MRVLVSPKREKESKGLLFPMTSLFTTEQRRMKTSMFFSPLDFKSPYIEYKPLVAQMFWLFLNCQTAFAKFFSFLYSFNIYLYMYI